MCDSLECDCNRCGWVQHGSAVTMNNWIVIGALGGQLPRLCVQKYTKWKFCMKRGGECIRMVPQCPVSMGAWHNTAPIQESISIKSTRVCSIGFSKQRESPWRFYIEAFRRQNDDFRNKEQSFKNYMLCFWWSKNKEPPFPNDGVLPFRWSLWAIISCSVKSFRAMLHLIAYNSEVIAMYCTALLMFGSIRNMMHIDFEAILFPFFLSLLFFWTLASIASHASRGAMATWGWICRLYFAEFSQRVSASQPNRQT